MKRFAKGPTSAVALLILVSATTGAQAWWPQGHSILSERRCAPCRQKCRRFFANGAGMIAHTTQDPDVSKNRDAPLVSDREAPSIT
jgi:hypothetical protein